MENLDLATLELLNGLESELEPECQEMLDNIDPDQQLEKFWTVGRGWSKKAR